MTIYEIEYNSTYFETLNQIIEFKLIYEGLSFDVLEFQKLMNGYLAKLSYFPNRNPILKTRKCSNIMRKYTINNYVFIYKVKKTIVIVYAVFNKIQNIEINFEKLFGNEA